MKHNVLVMGGGWLSKRATALPFLHPHMDEGGRGGWGFHAKPHAPRRKLADSL